MRPVGALCIGAGLSGLAILLALPAAAARAQGGLPARGRVSVPGPETVVERVPPGATEAGRVVVRGLPPVAVAALRVAASPMLVCVAGSCRVDDDRIPATPVVTLATRAEGPFVSCPADRFATAWCTSGPTAAQRTPREGTLWLRLGGAAMPQAGAPAGRYRGTLQVVVDLP